MDETVVVAEIAAVDREAGRCKVTWLKDDGGYHTVDMSDSDARTLRNKLKNLYQGE